MRFLISLAAITFVGLAAGWLPAIRIATSYPTTKSAGSSESSN